jgi:outer membrane protein
MKSIIIYRNSISVVACNKPEVKEVKLLMLILQLMKEYTEAKDLEEKYKAQSSEKGRQLEAEINRLNKMHQIFARQQANGQVQKRGAELQKREQN